MKGLYYSPFCFLRPHNILSAMLTNKKQRKTIVPVIGEYAMLVYPIKPRISPTANTSQTIALLAFSDTFVLPCLHILVLPIVALSNAVINNLILLKYVEE